MHLLLDPTSALPVSQVLKEVLLPSAILSFALNILNRGREVANVAIAASLTAAALLAAAG
jgi:hypothetical protein